MENEKKETKPAIIVNNVSMRFKISTGNVSGLKEFIINKISHKSTYRKFYALRNVSFEVNKGEVVGIIGTNGSGKSTLLRIISGALKPTSGNVVVDRRKIQLLTLGTGFDSEITARENVYLNGAIIGYSKEFLDANYDKIVEFAELQNFMDEKVKNFSSGMVSRLGFAIATAGKNADILILDEVLSVGDEFFKEKSMKRIKEMIHSGATVLIVSHSLSTIKENCTKVIWLNKGKLMMIGRPKKVCDAYSRMNVPGAIKTKSARKSDSSKAAQNAAKKNVQKAAQGRDNQGKTVRKLGFIKKGNDFILVKNGVPDLKFTGLINIYEAWWYVVEGRLNLEYTGLVYNAGFYWYVSRGKIDVTFSGKVMHEGKEYIVKLGKALG